MKSAPDGIDIDERQFMRVRAIGQKYKDAFRFGLNPKRSAGKTEMPEAVFCQRLRSGRIRSFRQLKRNRTRLIQTGREIRAKKFAGFGFEKRRLIRQKLLSDFESFFSGREKSGVSRDAAQVITISVVNFTPDLIIAPIIFGNVVAHFPTSIFFKLVSEFRSGDFPSQSLKPAEKRSR